MSIPTAFIRRAVRGALFWAALWLVFARATDAATEEVAPVEKLLREPSGLVAWLEAHNPEIAAAAARVTQAQADVAKSRLYLNPSLALSLGDINVGESNPPGLGFSQTAVTTIGIEETVEIGKRGPRVSSAQLRLEAARANLRDTLVQKASDARSALGKIVDLKLKLSMLEEMLITARNALGLERVRLEHGDLSGVEYDRLELDTIAFEADLAHTRADLAAALETCRGFVFARCDVGSVSAGDLTAPIDAPTSESELFSILSRRPDIDALLLQARSARQDAVLARRRVLPDPTVGVTYTDDRLTSSGDQPHTLLFSVSVPLPVFDRGQEDAAGAEAKASELERTARAILERSMAELTGLFYRRDAAQDSLRKLRSNAIPKSKGILDTIVAAFDRGQVSLTDMLLARRTHTELTLREIDDEFDLFSVNSDLRKALGVDAALASASAGNGG